MWDADFYIKVDDDVHVNIGKLYKNLLAEKNVKDSVSSFPILISFFLLEYQQQLLEKLLLDTGKNLESISAAWSLVQYYLKSKYPTSLSLLLLESVSQFWFNWPLYMSMEQRS